MNYVRDPNNNKNKVASFLLNELESSRSVIYYVHNLTFEAYTLLRNFIDLGAKIEWVNINSTVYSLTITTKTNKKIKVKCSYKMLGYSLSDISGIKDSFPYRLLYYGNYLDNFTPQEHMFNNSSSYIDFVEKNGTGILNFIDCLKKYNISDVVATKRVVDLFATYITSLDGSFQDYFSLSSLSLGLYYKRFPDSKVLKSIKPNEVSEYIRPSFFGGRVEVFGNAEPFENVLHFDYSGMYATQLLTDVPAGEFLIENNYQTLTSSKFMRNGLFIKPGFYRVETTNDLEIPVLPIRKKIGLSSKLVFPNGHLKGTY